MEKIEHTPTPWVQVGGGIMAGHENPVTIADCDRYAPLGLGLANAAFIVQAVNAHEGLVEALREVASQFDPADYREGSMERRLGDKARAALAGVKP